MKHEISFSGRIKEELSRHISEERSSRVAEIVAIVSMCGKVSINCRDEYTLRIHTENASVARKYFTLLKKTFNIEAEVVVSRHRPNDTVAYGIAILRHEYAMTILRATQLIDQDGEIAEHISLTKRQKRAYVRGAFLAAGSMSNPEKAYHIEIVCIMRKKAEQLQHMINSFGLDAKMIVRKKTYVVYLKESSQIVDLLNIMEAPVALMEMENVRILKEMRNMVNRKVNCETANINKTVSAAVKQVEDIRLIRDVMGFGELPEGLEEIAALRLENPNATLKELGELLSTPLGKSGVNHRLRKLSEIAEQLKED